MDGLTCEGLSTKFPDLKMKWQFTDDLWNVRMGDKKWMSQVFALTCSLWQSVMVWLCMVVYYSAWCAWKSMGSASKSSVARMMVAYGSESIAVYDSQ